MKKAAFSLIPGLHLLFLLLLLFPALSLYAYDFGLLLNQTAGTQAVYGETGDIADNFEYSATLIPWLSMRLGSSFTGPRLYLSGGVTLEYADQNSSFIPELFRTELTVPIGSGSEIKAGRMQYTDPLGWIASGLFDGAKFSYAGAKTGTLSLGAWYTGLLYKKSAQITMTNKELKSLNTKLDYANFSDTYFASRRLIAALDWDNPYLAQWLRLKAALISQFDLNGDDVTFHSRYLTVKASLPANSFVFNAGACFEELVEISDQDSSGKDFRKKISWAGELGIEWMLPTPITDRLMLTARYSSGTSGIFSAFVPVTTVNQGSILKAKFSGLSIISLDYTARLHEFFSINVVSSYFILNDLVTYSGLPGGRDGNILGNEFYGMVIVSPFSDLRVNVGGGVFLPSMGNASKGDNPIWRIDINAILAIF